VSFLVNPYAYDGNDQHFASVVLLLHCDGANGSTTIVDSSSFARAVNGNAQLPLTTAQFKFGTASVDHQVNTSFITCGDSADWEFGSGQFTVEAWIRRTAAISGVRALVAHWPSGSSNFGWQLGFNGSTLQFGYSTIGTDSPSVGAAYTPPLNTWVHIAADRDASNVLRVYADGVVIASATVAASIFNSTALLYIGNDGNNTRGFIGQIDEVRITKGAARYAGAFTPPTAAFPNQ